MENGKIITDTPDGAAPESPEGDRVELTQPNEQLEALLAEKAELQELLLRRSAEFDNYRKRSERERAEVRDWAVADAAQNLLPVLDDFERALKATPVDDGPVREYSKGFELIYQRLFDSLGKLGLEPVAAAGQPFDPNVHNAIQREERDDVEDQTVLEEYQRGYNFKGRPLRPAMVKVAVKP